MEITQVTKKMWSELHISIINQHDVYDEEIFKDYLKCILADKEFYIEDLFTLLQAYSGTVEFYEEARKVLAIWNNYKDRFYPWELDRYLSLARATDLCNCIEFIKKGVVEPRVFTEKELLRKDANKFNQKVVFELIERDGYVCKICGATKKLTVDHIIPVTKGGKNTLENCQLLCKSCNSRKGARC